MAEMIVTPTVAKNLKRLNTALQSSMAVLIQGEMGSGKSASIMELAERNGFKEKLIQINVDDSFDSKDLLGKYSATETPGVFDWIPGPLTEAVENGMWILMEDIDLASFDVFSVILTLLEDGTLFISDKNTTIQAHPDFKLIATQQLLSTMNGVLSAKRSNTVPYVELWGVVIMENLPPEEITKIVETLYPNVPSSILKELTLLRDSNQASLVNLRNLLQWSFRVNKRLVSSRGGSTDFLSSSVREIALKEGFDCFVAKYSPGKEQTDVLSLVCDSCGVPLNVAEPLVLENKPLERISEEDYSIGRVSLSFYSKRTSLSRDSRVAFAPTRLAMSLLEKLAASVEAGEHVLLTGETGVGKTFIVQYLADRLGQKLIVHNLNQQTDTTDFMGGWKPLDLGVSVRETYEEFSKLFSECFPSDKNVDFLHVVQESMNSRNWEKVAKLILRSHKSFILKSTTTQFSEETVSRWSEVESAANEILTTLKQSKANFAFRFEEGSLVKAWREGHWLLLDELNLATNDVLERVSSVLGDVDRLFLTDKSSKPIMRHKNFHVFANMNPPTDVGKKDLPPSLRSRFVEYYVSEPFNVSDVRIVVNEYIGHLTSDDKISQITQFFLDCVNNAKTKLCSLDGESKPPSFSLRTLTRALSYVRKAAPLYGFTVALYDGLLLGFATPLQRKFHAIVDDLIISNIFKGKRPPAPVLPQSVTKDGIPYEHIWITKGSETPITDPTFILAKSVAEHLRNLARAVFANRPVLLEGPTSSGKSSMVKYLADLTGNRFVRINNHDSTEVQEYLGHYVTDEHGKLRFVDGILVNAVRNGYWVVLDELNLAPSEVLEALNRLLDDNCELFIPDTQETIKPHPQLRIFATQNPAGIYGGRKMLSRAFRNRFLEITVDEIPVDEVSYILQKRYSLPESFSDKMVEIMTMLQVRRLNSQIFAGKHGFITPRDLFRWAERKPSTYQELAEHGFLLLGERCRKKEERQTVKDVIETVTKTELDESVIYSPSHWKFVNEYYGQVESGIIDEFKIVWTESMQRLFTVVGICLEHKEPVLLVGETGSSKTTVCQLWSALLGINLHIMNCHQHTEASDFLGGLRPSPPERRDEALFEWQNGPLVQSMLEGHYFLLDEISLTEDSVLERLNSVLEPSRSVTLAEKSTADHIIAHERFRVLATMNPGGDFGKKELSPALRNRFTEIYVRPTTDEKELTLILSKRLHPNLSEWASKVARILVNVSELGSDVGSQHVSIRDIISWTSFMNAAFENCSPEVSFLHGLDAVILDGIGVGTGQSEMSATNLRQVFLSQVEKWVPNYSDILSSPFWTLFDTMSEPILPADMQHSFFFGAPTTQRNLSKLMRASIVKKAVLLEGSPGVGKTSLVVALGCALGNPVVRINLSEQTDIMDLFGTFLPSPDDGGNGPRFTWSDGVLLRAVKEGSWVVLDELNLASQTVLEGLNALLDHRSAVFIPELNKEYHAHENFRVFACQNPLIEGGGRKGLPRSFLNRFIKARMEAFERSDLLCIAKAVCIGADELQLEKMVDFVGSLQHQTMVQRLFGVRGSPWEFNLRDVLRWINFMRTYNEMENPMYYADVLFVQRMRTEEDRVHCRNLLLSYFPTSEFEEPTNSDFIIHDNAVYFEGRRLCTRGPHQTRGVPLCVLPSQASATRSILMCVENRQFGLIVGPTGAGKSLTLKVAAQLAGAQLVTFSMNASCDTVDLLGGFDQVEGKQGQFEWRDSLVLEAMLQGHWLVLDNVNYCNASVLDRLNPLVEPDGVLSVNEQGLVDGKVRVIKPHPDFRMFATLNPKYGEISRAMRNRAVEIYMPPIAIPSAESLLLCNTVSSHEEQSLCNKLIRFHHEFVQVGFHADSSNVGSPSLSDALSVGSPNIFTLLRASLMLHRSGNLEGLRETIMHCYIDNRSGHWRMELSSLLETLDLILSDDDSPNNLPSVTQLLGAFLLQQGTNQEPLHVEEALRSLRVQRAGLHLAPYKNDNRFTDLMYFILDQCSDSVPLEVLAKEREKFLTLLGFPSELMGPLVDYKFSTRDALPPLACRTLQHLGPHSSVLREVVQSAVRPTNVPHINSKVLSVVQSCLQCISSFSDVLTFQSVTSVFVHFVKNILTRKIEIDNYIDIVAVSLLLLEVADLHNQLYGANINDFLEALERHFDFPFPLLGGTPILSAITARPHIATAEERSMIRSWRDYQATEVKAGTRPNWLRLLWICAAFRSEFGLVISLARLVNEAEEPSVKQISLFKAKVGAFVERFTSTLPVFNDLDIILWKNLLQMDTETILSSLPSQAPLIITNFFSRHKVDGIENLIVGSWCENAAKCLQLASLCSVIDIGRKDNGNTALMDDFLKFLTHCPVSSDNPFCEMRLNARLELAQILTTCYPPLRDIPVRGLQMSSLHEKCKGVIHQYVGDTVLNENKELVLRILAILEDPKCNINTVMCLLWSLKCRLLLPRSPIDTMYKLKWRMDISSEEKRLLSEMEEVFLRAEECTLRSAKTPQREIIIRLREREEEIISEVEGSYIERPDPSGARYAQLVHRLYHLKNSLFSDDRLFSLTEAVDQRNVVCQNWSALLFDEVREILDQYAGYEDVTLHFCQSALFATVACQANSYFTDPSQSSKTLFSREETLKLLQFPFYSVEKQPLPVEVETPLYSMKDYVSYLDFCLSLMSALCPVQTDLHYARSVFDAYRNFYKRVEQLEEQERRAEELSVLYKEKAVVIEGDDEKFVRRLNDLFPSYEQEFVDALKSDEDEEPIPDKSEPNAKSAKHARILLKEEKNSYILKLVKIHRLFYSNLASPDALHTLVDTKAMLQAFIERFDVLLRDVSRLSFDHDFDTESSHERLIMAGFAFRANRLKSQLSEPTTSLLERKEANFNIFKDPEPSEVALFSVALAKLIQTVDRLLASFPDTTSLLRCKKIAERIAHLPAASTPLMKVMSGCEVLLRECYEWERNASTQYSIIGEITELSSFVLRWRRLELHCWRHVFNEKSQEFRLGAFMEWFRFYDIIREDYDDEISFCVRVFEYVSQFMWSSSFGDYSARLEMLEGFGNELIVTCGFGAPAANTLFHLIEYFKQFRGLIENHHKKLLTPIEEEMEDFTKIMRWEDANYYAVRSTSEKSHLQVGRSLGSLEEVLRTPIMTCIQAEEQRIEDDAAMGFTVPSHEETAAKKREKGRKVKEEKLPNKKRKRQDTPIVSETLHPNEESDASVGFFTRAVTFFTESSETIIERVFALQQPKTPNQQKLRALKSLFDVMSESGVPQHMEEEVVPWELLFPSFECMNGCRGTRTVGDPSVEGQTNVVNASDRYYKFVRWVQRMREAKKKPHTDLSGAQVSRGTSMVESLLADSKALLNLLTFTFNLMDQVKVVSQVTSSFSFASEERESVSVNICDKVLETCIQECCYCKCFFESIRSLAEAKLIHPTPEEYTLLDELRGSVESLWAFCREVDGLRQATVELPFSVKEKCLTSLRSITGIAGRLRGSGADYVGNAAASLEERCILVLQEMETDHQIPDKKPRVSLDTATTSLTRVKDALQAIELVVLKQKGTKVAEESMEYQSYSQGIKEMMGVFTTEESVLKEYLFSFSRCDADPKEVSGIVIKCDALRKDLQSLASGLLHVLSEHSHLGTVVSRLFTVLMKKGFCKTEEEEEENDGEGDGGQQEGTGMDDGEGEKDVTDQIENEDQLMNMKDKEEPQEQEKDGKDENDEDNAADVETDFQGNKEGRDESEEDEDAEGEESDKEIGSVDEGDEQERKRTKKDETDDNDMREDDGAQADEVQQDDFNQEEENDEETGGFKNKEDEIKDTEEEREGEREMIADDGEAMSDGEMDDVSGDSSDNQSDSKESGEPNSEDEKDDLEESVQGSEDASHSHHDSSAETDEDRSQDGEREIENEESGLDGEDEEFESNSDIPDQNVFEGGQQDENVGKEATENKKEKMDSKQPDTVGNEEEQAGDEQELDDAGRNWKKQQEQNLNAQRKDNTEQNRSKKNNPYKAVKEALKRHQQQVQQLNLNKNVEVKDDKEKAEENKTNDANKEEDIGDFDFDSEGEMEGMAATENRPEKPTEAEEEPVPPQRDHDPEEEPISDEEDADDDAAPQDTRKRRKKPVDDINEIEEDEETTTKASKVKHKLKVSNDKVEDSDEDSSDDEKAPDEPALEEKMQNGRVLWQEQEAAVQGLSHQLCEQLRLILAPTLADKLQGDYKTGKRLNMKRIIPYIASQYKKDRIWLRRTKPNKRTYQVLIALDDSLSMQANNAGVTSCRAVALIAKALQQLEVGEMGIVTFGRETNVVHRLEDPFIADSGARAFSEITFQQKSTNLKNFFDSTLNYLDESRDRQRGQSRSTTEQLQQVLFVISDGQITEDRLEIKKLMARAEINNQMVVFILLDIEEKTEEEKESPSSSRVPLSSGDLKGLSAAERIRRLKADRESRLKRVQSKSVLDMQIVEFNGGKVVKRPYMEDFPFPYYVIVRDIERLPEIVSDAMRQWFELLNSTH